MRIVAVLVAVSVVVAAPAADATYSIVAVDTSTAQQVGGTGTSCVGRFTVYRIYGSVPGTGVVHAQARLNDQGLDRAVLRLGEGQTPGDIIQEITAPGFDGIAAQRQYGIVDLTGASAAFTGNQCGNHASDRTGTVDSYVYSTQGNILTSRAVIDQASDAFEAGGCDLADRLMNALEAGALNNEGDSRCTPDGIPSDGAFIQVDRPGEAAGSWLLLRVDDVAPMNPVTLLRAEFDAWRIDNPCPVAPAPDAGFFDADPPDVMDAAEDAAVEVGVVDTGVPPVDSGLLVDAGPSGIDTGRTGVSGRISGCGCRTEHRDPAAPVWPVWLLGIACLSSRRAKLSGRRSGKRTS